MFSNDSARQADACRFCWMCRHICPVGGASGNEAFTPRARGLMVSMVERGTDYDESIATAMYMCSMCEACANDCATGYKPTDFIREARLEALVQGFAPKAVLNAIDNIESKNNIYGLAEDEKVLEAIDGLGDEAECVLYLGQTARSCGAKTSIALVSLLKKAGVNFTVLKNEPDSGAFLAELQGYTSEVQTKAKDLAQAIEKTMCKKLVVLNPHDACILKEKYKEWGLLTDIEIVTATTYLSELIAEKALTPKNIDLTASLHEPCHLVRGLDELEPTRKIIESLGIKHQQLFLNGKMSRCCGGPVLNSHAPEITQNMAKQRINDAKRIGSQKIITACPDCTHILNVYNDTKIEILDLFELLNENC